MIHLLLAVIYLSFISLGLPDALLGSAWPAIYEEFQVPVSYAGIISMIIAELCFRETESIGLFHVDFPY